MYPCFFSPFQKTGLRRPPPRQHPRVSDIGVDSASTSSFRLAHIQLDHPFKRPATTTCATDHHRACVYTIKLWGAAAFAPLGPQCRCLWSTPPLVVAVLRGTLLSISTSPVDFLPLHRHGAAAVLSSRTAASPLSSSSSSFAHQQPRRPHWSSSAAQGLLPRLRALPPHLQAATVATLGRWCSYLYMATNIAIQAVGLTTRPSSSSSMIHRQCHRISLDYISLFSGNCALLRQFSLYAVLASRPSWRPSLLVSCNIGI
uniref:Uncharacterized protein n=1 Tax=Oryza rufipogon TaxID=4529 RepID=A0A0E0N495_ORYRU